MAGKKRSVGEGGGGEDQQQQQQLVRKRTRDLPNLCDCHSCGFHVSNVGQDKLQTLASQWRIVLLCNKCFYSVESAQICSYCYLDAAAPSPASASGSAPDDCFRCPQCRRRVHRECVFQRRGVAPWSYACSGSDLLVCIDCWAPKPVAGAKNGGARIVGEFCSLGGSRVSENGDGGLGLMDVVRDANLVAEKKIADAARTREKALSKAMVARRAVKLANSALKLVSGRDAALNDAELAAQLHRALNSSTRISRNNCLKTSSLRLTYHRRRIRGKIGMCANGKLQENPDRTALDSSFHGQVMDNVETCTADYEGKENNDSGGNGQKTTLEGEGSCSNKLNALGVCDNNMESESSSSCQFKHTDVSAASMDERCSMHDRYLNKYRKRLPGLNWQLKNHEYSAASVDERCIDDRYLKKYSRRSTNPSCHLEYHEECATVVNESCSMHDWCVRKYSKVSRGSYYQFKHLEDCAAAAVVDEKCSMHDRYFKKYSKRPRSPNSKTKPRQ